MSGSPSSKHQIRLWTQWAGRGFGPLAEITWRATEVVIGVLSLVSIARDGDEFFPGTIRGRVRRCRRGGYEATPGVWREDGGTLIPVNVVLDTDDLRIEGDGFTLSLSGFCPAGILDYPARPRTTTSNGIELASGVVLRSTTSVAELLLLRRSELAVLAILAGWPAPTALPHGQDAAEILSATS